MRRQRGQIGLMAVTLVGMLTSAAVAQVTTEQSASILVFPKVIADGSRDTIIQISNTNNSLVYAHCFYVNGASTLGGPVGPLNPPLCTETDFDITLTRQQPTHWVVSQGRTVDPTDPPCTRTNPACNGAGFDPGRVPPVVPDFTGELKCVEVDASGAPMSGNHLKGEATLVTLAPGLATNGDVAKYNALGIVGLETNNADNVLCLGGQPGGACANGAEYNACPQTWILDSLAADAHDQVTGDGRVDQFITVVPCQENFETQVATSVTVQFAVTNEYEQTFSASTTVTCWAELQLDDINRVFHVDFVGSDFIQTRMRPSAGTASGFLVVADALYKPTQGQAATANNLHEEGTRTGTDLITIPSEQVPPPQQ
jgi:hypothetical protein